MVMNKQEMIERLNRRLPPTGALLGMQVLDLDQDEGTIRISYEAKAEFCNPMGNVQGGFVAAMLDDAAALAVIVKSRARISIPTLEFKVSFLAPARMGALFAEGRCLRLGRTIAFMESTLLDAGGKKLAVMTATGMPVAAPENPTFVTREQ